MVCKLNLKTLKQIIPIEIDDEASISNLRQLAAEKLGTSAQNICMINNGKIIRDTDTFSDAKIQSGITLHVMIKSSKEDLSSKSATATATKPEQIPTTTSSVQPNMYEAMLSNLPTGQNMLFNNPEMIAQFASSPMLQNLLSDPTVMDTLINSNPQLKSVMESHPEIAEIIRNPESLKYMMEVMKNPTLYQEALRSQDRILSQLENIPGGMNQITRLFTEINRPAQNTAPQSNPFTTLRTGAGSTNVTSDRSQANISGSPLPNPWSSNTKSTPNPSSASDNKSKGNSLMNDFEKNFGTSHNESPNQVLLDALYGQIQQGIQSLSPRGQYGFAEFIKGFEVLREESPYLVGLMLNYHFLTTQVLNSNALAPESPQPTTPTFTEESLTPQLQELQLMGFENKDENLQALRYSFGDVSGAVNWILSRRGNH